MKALPAQLLRFGMVGTIGFLVDAGIVLLLTHYLPIGPLPARVISFIIAATVTWSLNRSFTFESASLNRLKEWGKYLLTTSAGAFVNVLVYKFWLFFTDTSPTNLILGVAAGSIVAMGINFAISKKFIFQ